MIDFAKSDDHGKTERYWLDQFSGPLPRLDLPADRPRPARKTFNGDRIDVELDPTIVRGLNEVATRSGSSFVTPCWPLSNSCSTRSPETMTW
jgi:fengycin family lipopeptide synthetase A